MEVRPVTLSELADDVEVFTSRRVPAAVACAIAASYTAEEASVVYAALGRIHRARYVLSVVRQLQRQGLTIEQAKPEAALTCSVSEAWVDWVLYPRGKAPRP